MFFFGTYEGQRLAATSPFQVQIPQPAEISGARARIAAAGLTTSAIGENLLKFYPTDPSGSINVNAPNVSNMSTFAIKLLEDGVPTESHTAAMLEPYEHAPGAEPARGMLMIPPEKLNPMVTRFDQEGMTVKFHAAGDWAVRTAMDAIAAARKANGPNGPTHDPGHLTFVHPADLARTNKYTRLFSGRKLGKTALLKFIEQTWDNQELPSHLKLRVLYVPIVGVHTEPTGLLVEIGGDVEFRRVEHHRHAERLGPRAACRVRL